MLEHGQLKKGLTKLTLITLASSSARWSKKQGNRARAWSRKSSELLVATKSPNNRTDASLSKGFSVLKKDLILWEIGGRDAVDLSSDGEVNRAFRPVMEIKGMFVLNVLENKTETLQHSLYTYEL